jgi:chemotaxis protein methyltransferase CheR
MAITPAEFAYIRGFVKSRSALMLEPGKEYLVESRLEALARQEGFPSLSSLIHTLRSSPASDLHRLVVEAMTTNETSFFRDIRVFDMFKRRILPELVERRSAARALTVWCAASSCGQEPYSLAMTLKEHRPALGEWDITLIASDISREQQGHAWHIRSELRAMLRCWEINLATNWPVLPRMDVIFMRNVLIYFDIETKKAILAKAARLLRADGYLVLGGAETTTNLDDAFEAVTLDGATCFRLKRQ